MTNFVCCMLELELVSRFNKKAERGLEVRVLLDLSIGFFVQLRLLKRRVGRDCSTGLVITDHTGLIAEEPALASGPNRQRSR